MKACEECNKATASRIMGTSEDTRLRVCDACFESGKTECLSCGSLLPWTASHEVQPLYCSIVCQATTAIKVGVLVVAMALASCSTKGPVVSNPNKSDEEFHRDNIDCQLKGKLIGYQDDQKGHDFMVRCMKGYGWKHEKEKN